MPSPVTVPETAPIPNPAIGESGMSIANIDFVAMLKQFASTEYRTAPKLRIIIEDFGMLTD